MSEEKSETDTEEKKGLVNEFTEFVQKFNFIALAIGFIVGAASKDVIDSLVKDIFSPLVGVFIPQSALESVVIEVANAEIKIGAFLNEVLTFVIISVIVFFVAVKLMKIQVKK